VKRKMLLPAVGAAALVAFAFNAFAQFDKPVVKRWTAVEKNEKGKEESVRYMTIDGIMVHELSLIHI